MLTILSEIHCFTAEMLSLLPPKLRSRILLHLPAIDLYKLGNTNNLWVGLPFTNEDVWKSRFEATLKKYTNVSCLEEEISMTWLDRYLVSCLLNVPVYYESILSHPPFGAAFFVISDVSLNDVGIVKAKIDSNGVNGLMGLKTRKKSSSASSHLISKVYHKRLQSYPFAVPVGTQLTTYDRIKVMLTMFRNWSPSILPLEFDDHSPNDYDTMLCTSFLSKVRTIYILSKYLRSHPYAEVEDVNSDNPPGIGHFCKFVVDLMNGHDNATCNRLIIPSPAMKKELFYTISEGDGDTESSFSYKPLSFTANELMKWFFERFPNIKNLSVSMHDTHQDCWTSSVFNEAKLESLQLKVTRPTFKHITTPLISFSLISEMSLHGLAIEDKHFCDILLAVLNSPIEQKFSLANVKIIDNNNSQPLANSQVMETACHYKTSLNLHRIRGVNVIESILLLYQEMWLNDLSIYLIDVDLPFPKSTVINCKSLHVNRFTLGPNNMDVLSPVLKRANGVYLSLGNSIIHTATFSLPMISQLIQICQQNLQYLDCKHAFPYPDSKIDHLNIFFTAVFRLPKCTLANLTFDPSRLILCIATTTTHSVANLMTMLQLQQNAVVNDLQNQKICWHLLCQVWKNISNGVKIKCLSGVSSMVLDEMEDDLHEVAHIIKLL